MVFILGCVACALIFVTVVIFVVLAIFTFVVLGNVVGLSYVVALLIVNAAVVWDTNVEAIMICSYCWYGVFVALLYLLLGGYVLGSAL